MQLELTKKDQVRVNKITKMADNYYSILQDYDNFVKNRRKFWTAQFKLSTKYLPGKKKLIKDLFRFRQIHSRIDTDTYGHLDDAKKVADEIWRNNLKLKQQLSNNKTFTSIQENINKEIKNTHEEFVEISKKISQIPTDNEDKMIFPNKGKNKKAPQSHLMGRMSDDASFLRTHSKRRRNGSNNNNTRSIDGKNDKKLGKKEQNIIQRKYKELETNYLDLRVAQNNILRKIQNCIREHPPLNSQSALINVRANYFYDNPNPNILHVKQLTDNIFRIHFNYNKKQPEYKDFIFQLDPLKCKWIITNVIKPQIINDEDDIPQQLIRV